MTAKKTGAKKASRGQSESQAPTHNGSLRAPHKTKGGALLPKGAAGGAGTATGAERINDTKEIPSGKEAGSTQEIVGGSPKPDDDNKGGKPKGLQAEPAIWAPNGSLEPNSLPSPSGPVSVAAVESDPKKAQERLDAHRERVKKEIRSSGRKLSEEQVQNMGRAEIAAVGHQRGYDMPDAGTRVTRAAFLRAQDEDEYAVDED